MTPHTFEEMVLRLQEECMAIMVERHVAYGPKNISRTGPRGTLLKMADKLARLEHLMGEAYLEAAAEGLPTDPAIEDSLIDLANYADILRAQLRGWWTADHCPPLAST